ncbi:beta strand repeat-containing protein [Aeromonas simiae]|uniref:beta strand repeat-containing protein n=1 Tax=Aeromonas simiae TaxID=218936 RepID=UPI0018675BBE|nr:Ig-like domain-containing protein [Aeromonas simiae]
MVTITATYQGLTSNTSTLTITDAVVSKVQVIPPAERLAKGLTLQLKAIATMSDGSTQEITGQSSWSSNKPDILSVDVKKGLATGLAIGQATITAAAQGKKGEATITVSELGISRIQLLSSTATLAKGTSVKIKAMAILEDNSSADISTQASWSSSDSTVATVDASGTVKGIAAGKATINAALKGVKASTSLTISNATVAKLHIIPTSATLAIGTRTGFKAIATLSDNTTQDVTTQVNWSSSDEQVITINAQGVATAIARGNALIRAAIQGISHEVAIEVSNAVPTTLQIQPSNATLAQGLKLPFTAQATFSDGSTQDVTSLVAWDSDDISLLTIDLDGLATAVKPGNVTVSASWQGLLSNLSQVTVSNASVQSIQVIPATTSLALGTQVHFTAIATLSDGSTVDITNQADWITSNAAIVTIDASGLATAIAKGSATLSATLQGVTHSASVTITDATVASLHVIPPSAMLALGTQLQLQAIATFSDGTTQDMSSQVAWLSDNASVLVVSLQGEVSAVDVGSAHVSAKIAGVSSAPVAITVTDATVSAIQITPTTLNLAIGTQAKLTATATLSDGSVQDVSDQASWSSSDPTVASISSQGLVTAQTKGDVTISAHLQGVTQTATLSVSDAVVATIQVIPPTATLAKGTKLQLQAVATFSDGSTQDISSQVAWLSDTPSILVVSLQGEVSAVDIGSAHVSAKIAGVSSAPVAITVTDATLSTIQISPPTLNLTMGAQAKLTATAAFSDGSVQDVSGQVSWSSSDPTVASVSSQGLVTTQTKGNVTISATLQGVTHSASVTITDATVASLHVIPPSAMLALGTQLQLQAIATFSDGTTQDMSSQVAWLSDNASVLVVSLQGEVSAVDVGSAHVSAKIAGVSSAPVAITVTDATVSAIQITPTTLNLAIGTQAKLTATATLSDGSVQDVSDQASWSSSDPTVASISSQGLVTAQTKGDVTISAHLQGVTQTATLSVSDAVVATIQVIPPTATLAKGTKLQLQAVATFSDGSTQDVSGQASWLTSTPTLLTISTSGEATALAKGSANVTASLGGVTSNQAALTITDATLVSLQAIPPSASLALGTKLQLQAIATFSDGSTQDVTDQVNWLSNAPGVIAVSLTGEANSVAQGSATVTAHTGSIDSNPVTLTVTSATVQSLQVIPATLNLAMGTQTQMSALATLSDGSVQDVSSQVSWSSSDPAVATVTSQGMVSAIAKGSVTIGANLQGISQSASLTITDAVVSSIQVIPPTPSLAAGTKLQFQALATFSDGTTQDVSGKASWISSATDVLAINLSGEATGLKAGNATVTATLGGVTSNGASVTVTNAVVSTVQISLSGASSLAKGTSVQFSAQAILSDGTTQDVSNQVSWLSSDTSRVTIDASGKATAVALGSSNISAKINGVESTPITLTVTDATLAQLQVTPATITLAKGTSQQLTAMATFSDGSTQNLTSQVSWGVTPSSIATVSGSGQLTAVATGSATVVATQGGISSNEAQLTVTAATVSSIEIGASSTSLAAGSKTQLSAKATLSDGSEQDVSSQVSWSSSDANVATVNASGQVTAVNPGSATIHAQLNGVAQDLAITVTPATVASIDLKATDSALALGLSTQLQALATYSDGNVVDVTSQVNWGSSDTSVLGVDANGKVTALGIGNATVTGQLGGVSQNIGLSVTNAVITGISITPIDPLAKGTQGQLKAIATLSDLTQMDVSALASWSSNNTSVATVDLDGTVSGVNVGTATIRASLGGESATTAVTVTAATLSSLTLSATESLNLLTLARTLTFTVMATYSDGSQQNVTSSASIRHNGSLITLGVGNTYVLVNLLTDSTFQASLNGVNSNTLLYKTLL